MGFLNYFNKKVIERKLKRGETTKVLNVKKEYVFVGMGDSAKQRINDEAREMAFLQVWGLLGMTIEKAWNLDIAKLTYESRIRLDREDWPTYADISVTITIDLEKLLEHKKGL